MANRRSFLIGIGAALAAPAIVRAESIMRVAVLRKSLNEATLLEALAEHVRANHVLYLQDRLYWVSAANDVFITLSEPLDQTRWSA